MTLDEFNELPENNAVAMLRTACGSDDWARAVAARRPFRTLRELLAASDEAWWNAGPDEWQEAFKHHPRIGGRKAAKGQSTVERRWSAGEQSGVQPISDAERRDLASLNSEYEKRFGFIFIVAAEGRTTGEVMQALRERLAHDPMLELRVAAEEQRKITHGRIRKLLVVPESSGVGPAFTPSASTPAGSGQSAITTHVLDTSAGKPAAGVRVGLDRREGESWKRLGEGTTDNDGRLRTLLPDGEHPAAGHYRLVFETGAYLGDSAFFPRVAVEFSIRDGTAHHHVPLLLSPYGYSTYRGS